MKLLFDQMLSPKLIRSRAQAFPESTHVEILGFGTAADPVVWAYARDHGFTIVTKDSDYEDLSLIRGSPPKVILVVSGNGPSEPVRRALLDHREALAIFASQRNRGVFRVG